MKRVLVTTFAALYAIALIVGAANRTASWAARNTEAAMQKASGPAFQAARDFKKHHPNRRILQSPFVVAPPIMESGVTLLATAHKVHAPTFIVWRIDGSPVPSRAPPSLV